MRTMLVVAVILANTSMVRAQQVASTVTRQAETSAGPSEGRITVRFEGTPLRRAVRNIIEQAKLDVTYSTQMIPGDVRVTYTATDVTGMRALTAVLANTGVRVVVTGGGTQFKLVREDAAALGGIQGVIRDGKTKQPLRGATVVLDGASRGVVTKEDGAFRFAEVSSGAHTVGVRLLGYGKVARAVTVTEGQTASIELTLDPSVSALDQVVVTGTVVATELKAVPNAITVITAKQIQERGITRIDQLFRGEIPGLFSIASGSREPLDAVTMFSRGATTMSDGPGTNPIKTYVDGIEMADPRFLSQIDPMSIERIEILTGPQASTIYGSNALNGVMQIFTKRGTSARPQLTLNLLSGWVENNFRSARTPQHDHSMQVTGVESRLSYNAGGSWEYMGPWTPAKKTIRTNIYTGARYALPTLAGGITADVSFRHGNTQNKKAGSAEQGVVNASEAGWRPPMPGVGVAPWIQDVLGVQTVGATFGYTPTSWWSHELGIGVDGSEIESTQYKSDRIYGQADSLLSFSRSGNEKRSLRYTSTARIPMTSLAQATITLGADARQELTTYTWGRIPNTVNGYHGGITFSRQPSHNTGGFLQAQLGILDALFFTYGLRAEWNPDFGSDALPSYAPRYGIAYTRDVGAVTTKLRASYGRSTRPPALDQKNALLSDDRELVNVYGPYARRVANPMLGPEHQQGGEAGLEFYFGGRASLVVTRYNQTVDGLIVDVPGADSTRSLQPNPMFWGGSLDCAAMIARRAPDFCSSQDSQGYGYIWQSQNMNVAGIRNQGWELQGSVVTGPVTTRGTYSWTKSRSMGVTQQYRNAIAGKLSVAPQYGPGATFMFLPEHTWAVGMTYARARTTLAMTVSGIGQTRSYDDEFFVRNIDSGIRLAQNRMRMKDFTWIDHSPGYALADLTASHRFQSHIEGVLTMQNVGNHYAQDFSARFATLGRQGKLGLRIRW